MLWLCTCLIFLNLKINRNTAKLSHEGEQPWPLWASTIQKQTSAMQNQASVTAWQYMPLAYSTWASAIQYISLCHTEQNAGLAERELAGTSTTGTGMGDITSKDKPAVLILSCGQYQQGLLGIGRAKCHQVWHASTTLPLDGRSLEIQGWKSGKDRAVQITPPRTVAQGEYRPTKNVFWISSYRSFLHGTNN